MSRNPHHDSTLNSFLEEQGMSADCKDLSAKEILQQDDSMFPQRAYDAMLVDLNKIEGVEALKSLQLDFFSKISAFLRVKMRQYTPDERKIAGELVNTVAAQAKNAFSAKELELIAKTS